MADGLLILLVLLNVYVVGLILLHRAGKLRGPGLELAGPLLLVKTEHGKQLIDRVSRPKRFWKAYGDIGVVLTWIAGVLVIAVLLLNIYLLITQPAVAKRAVTPPETLLVIPGVNPIIPIWYGIFALAIALIVHEGAHGVLARAHGIKVKSLGLLMLVVPIGAFVEPDDAELERAPTRAKNRVFAAGVMTNLVVAFLTVLCVTGMWGAAQPAAHGMGVTSIVPMGNGQGAEAAGLQPGSVMTAIDGVPIYTFDDFNTTLNQHHALDTVQVTVWRDGATSTKSVQLADKYLYYQQHDRASNNEDYRGKGFMGVSTLPGPVIQSLRDAQADPLRNGLLGFLFFISLPLQGFPLQSLSPLPQSFEHFYAVQGALGALPLPLFWMLVNAFYWIFWLNLMVGTFNALPLGFLDGGQMFKASVKGVLRRRAGISRDRLVVEKPELSKQVIVRGVDTATQVKLDRVDKLVRRTTLTVGLVIVGLILVPIIGPRLL
ncbi:MAG: site-2 protease family protein [Halobacteriales archaeon]|nr:site-2 protease family protein [Halobacteriales archaeon]